MGSRAKNAPKDGECRLCRETGVLRRSHIIPEFLYEPLYDPKHRIVGISALEGRKPDSNLQKGLREPLLCGDCEGELGELERYAAGVVRRFPDLHLAKPGEAVPVSGIDYSRFKLFQISLIWRMGITSIPTFSEVQLGPHHESALRRMLLEKDPGEPSEYGCLLIRTLGAPLQCIMRPRTHRFQGHRGYLSTLGGLIWLFFVSGHARELADMKGVLSKEGVLWVYLAPESTEDFMRGLGRNLRAAGYRLE